MVTNARDCVSQQNRNLTAGRRDSAALERGADGGTRLVR